MFSSNLKIYQLSSFKLICILSASIVPLLVIGPFFPDLIVSTLSMWFLYYSYKIKYYNKYQNSYFYIFIAFWLVCILSSLLSDNISLSLKSSLFYVRIGIFALLISYLIDQNKKILDYFYYSFLLTFSILIIDGYYQYFNEYNLLGYPVKKDFPGFRVSSFFKDELILGSYLVRLLPLCIALFVIRKKNQWEYYFFPIFLIMVSILILMSGERASLFFLLLSFLFILIFMSNFKLARVLIILLIVSLITTFAIKDKKFHQRFIQGPIQSMGLDGSKKYFFTKEHDRLFRIAWKMFIDKPILGHGPKMFRIKCKEFKYSDNDFCHPHPHNFYLQLLAETGILGFSFLIVIFFYFVYLMMKHIIDYFRLNRVSLTDYQICLLSGLLITIWPLTTNGSLFTNNLMLLYGLQIGFFRKEI